jgi:hypothetical protein
MSDRLNSPFSQINAITHHYLTKHGAHAYDPRVQLFHHQFLAQANDAIQSATGDAPGLERFSAGLQQLKQHVRPPNSSVLVGPDLSDPTDTAAYPTLAAALNGQFDSSRATFENIADLHDDLLRNTRALSVTPHATKRLLENHRLAANIYIRQTLTRLRHAKGTTQTHTLAVQPQGGVRDRGDTEAADGELFDQASSLIARQNAVIRNLQDNRSKTSLEDHEAGEPFDHSTPRLRRALYEDDEELSPSKRHKPDPSNDETPEVALPTYNPPELPGADYFRSQRARDEIAKAQAARTLDEYRQSQTQAKESEPSLEAAAAAAKELGLLETPPKESNSLGLPDISPTAMAQFLDMHDDNPAGALDELFAKQVDPTPSEPAPAQKAVSSSPSVVNDGFEEASTELLPHEMKKAFNDLTSRQIAVESADPNLIDERNQKILNANAALVSPKALQQFLPQLANPLVVPQLEKVFQPEEEARRPTTRAEAARARNINLYLEGGSFDEFLHKYDKDLNERTRQQLARILSDEPHNPNKKIGLDHLSNNKSDHAHLPFPKLSTVKDKALQAELKEVDRRLRVERVKHRQQVGTFDKAYHVFSSYKLGLHHRIHDLQSDPTDENLMALYDTLQQREQYAAHVTDGSVSNPQRTLPVQELTRYLRAHGYLAYPPSQSIPDTPPTAAPSSSSLLTPPKPFLHPTPGFSAPITETFRHPNEPLSDPQGLDPSVNLAGLAPQPLEPNTELDRRLVRTINRSKAVQNRLLADPPNASDIRIPKPPTPHPNPVPNRGANVVAKALQLQDEFERRRKEAPALNETEALDDTEPIASPTTRGPTTEATPPLFESPIEDFPPGAMIPDDIENTPEDPMLTKLQAAQAAARRQVDEYKKTVISLQQRQSFHDNHRETLATLPADFRVPSPHSINSSGSTAAAVNELIQRSRPPSSHRPTPDSLTSQDSTAAAINHFIRNEPVSPHVSNGPSSPQNTSVGSLFDHPLMEGENGPRRIIDLTTTSSEPTPVRPSPIALTPSPPAYPQPVRGRIRAARNIQPSPLLISPDGAALSDVSFESVQGNQLTTAAGGRVTRSRPLPRSPSVSPIQRTTPVRGSPLNPNRLPPIATQSPSPTAISSPSPRPSLRPGSSQRLLPPIKRTPATPPPANDSTDSLRPGSGFGDDDNRYDAPISIEDFQVNPSSDTPPDLRSGGVDPDAVLSLRNPFVTPDPSNQRHAAADRLVPGLFHAGAFDLLTKADTDRVGPDDSNAIFQAKRYIDAEIQQAAKKRLEAAGLPIHGAETISDEALIRHHTEYGLKHQLGDDANIQFPKSLQEASHLVESLGLGKVPVLDPFHASKNTPFQSNAATVAASHAYYLARAVDDAAADNDLSRLGPLKQSLDTILRSDVTNQDAQPSFEQAQMYELALHMLNERIAPQSQEPSIDHASAADLSDADRRLSQAHPLSPQAPAPAALNASAVASDVQSLLAARKAARNTSLQVPELAYRASLSVPSDDYSLYPNPKPYIPVGPSLEPLVKQTRRANASYVSNTASYARARANFDYYNNEFARLLNTSSFDEPRSLAKDPLAVDVPALLRTGRLRPFIPTNLTRDLSDADTINKTRANQAFLEREAKTLSKHFALQSKGDAFKQAAMLKPYRDAFIKNAVASSFYVGHDLQLDTHTQRPATAAPPNVERTFKNKNLSLLGGIQDDQRIQRIIQLLAGQDPIPFPYEGPITISTARKATRDLQGALQKK